MQKLSVYITFIASCSSESGAAKTTKTSTGESSLTGAIVETWPVTAGILRGKRKRQLMNANK